MESSASPSRTEMLAVADAVAREKQIDRDEVLQAMEQAIQRAARAKYGHEHDIRAHVDRDTGEIKLQRVRTVVADDAEIEDEFAQIRLARARKEVPGIEVGAVMTDNLPPIDFGRIAAQTAKQVIVQHVREAERARQFNEFKEKVGEIVNGTVKRVEFGNVTVELPKGEGIIKRDEALPRETFRPGDRVRALVYDVRSETRGPQIFLSRARPEFMALLFKQEVPEIYDGIIEIKSVARDPGSRAKIAVSSNDGSIDPVGACVGMRGSRVQAVVGELAGEKIDIIPWSSNSATFVVNALAPAEVSKVVVDEEARKIEVVVAEDQLSLAIGRRGQNVRLASMLTGWDIDILTVDEESKRRQEEFMTRSKLFVDALDLEDYLAHLLVTENFAQIEDLLATSVADLSAIDGINEALAEELHNRARAWVDARNAALEDKRRALGVDDAVAAIANLAPEQLVLLGEGGVKTLDDLADLTGDELRFLLLADKGGKTVESLAQMDEAAAQRALAASPLTADDANAIVMAARQHWFPEGASADGQSGAEA